MNIIELTLFIIKIMTSPFLLLTYIVGRKDRHGHETTFFLNH